MGDGKGGGVAEVRWHKLRREEVAAAAGCIVLLAIGSVQQHGPHLPLHTDTNAATEVAEWAAQLDPRMRLG